MEAFLLGEIVGIISADMTDPHDSWLRIQIGESTQRISWFPDPGISADANGSLSAPQGREAGVISG